MIPVAAVRVTTAGIERRRLVVLARTVVASVYSVSVEAKAYHRRVVCRVVCA